MAPQLISMIQPELNTDTAELDSLILRVAAQDSAALHDLYEKTSSAIYAFSLSILKNTHDAEDVLHDCYLNLCSAAGSYRPTGKPMAWILTVARNLCLMKLREYKKSADIPQEDWEPYLQSREGLSKYNRSIKKLNTYLSQGGQT